MPSPKLKAVVIASKTIHGEFSLRAIKDAKQKPLQLVLRDAGFVPGDIVQIGLLEEYEDLHKRVEDLQNEVEDLQNEIIEFHRG